LEHSFLPTHFDLSVPHPVYVRFHALPTVETRVPRRVRWRTALLETDEQVREHVLNVTVTTASVSAEALDDHTLLGKRFGDPQVTLELDLVRPSRGGQSATVRDKGRASRRLAAHGSVHKLDAEQKDRNELVEKTAPMLCHILLCVL